MEIRRANLLDVSALLVLLSRMEQDGSANGVLQAPDWPKVSHTVVDSVANGLTFVAADDQHRVVGSIGGGISSLWYTHQPVLGDYWFYIDPEFRAGKTAVGLLEEFKKEGEARGLPVHIAHVFGDEIGRKDALYERKGFRKVGSLFHG